MFALLSSVPRFNELIKPFIALAPAAYMGFIPNVAARTAAYNFPLLTYFTTFGGPSETRTQKFDPNQCSSAVANLQPLCRLNPDRIPVYYTNVTRRTSAKNRVHWAQLVRSHRFQWYDHGIWSNWIVYKRATRKFDGLSLEYQRSLSTFDSA